MTAKGGNGRLPLSYLTLRRTLGILGMALPVILVIGGLIFTSNSEIENTISDYYDTIMVGVFVGVLFAIATFMFSYLGYEMPNRGRFEATDNIAGNLAALFAVLVALFPTTHSVQWVRGVHLASALLFFMTLAYFSIHLFTKTTPGETAQGRKADRNRIYRVCGWAIILFIALIAVYFLFFQDTGIADLKPVLVLESLALWAFGISWLVKGDTLLQDSPPAR